MVEMPILWRGTAACVRSGVWYHQSPGERSDDCCQQNELNELALTVMDHPKFMHALVIFSFHPGRLSSVAVCAAI
jgi:hypothetical protein